MPVEILSTEANLASLVAFLQAPMISLQQFRHGPQFSLRLLLVSSASVIGGRLASDIVIEFSIL